MLGYMRFSLAILVALNHLWLLGGVGRLAVFSFYVISGYLMTAIVTTTYGTTAIGLKKYALNRLLRIYPSYIVCFITFTFLLHGIDRPLLQVFDLNLSIPSSTGDWFMNSTLLGLDFSVKDRTVPPSWTLFVELFFYAVIPLILKIDKRLLLFWLAWSIGYHTYLMIWALPTDASLAWNSRYGTIMAGSLGFSFGATCRLYIPQWLKTKRAAVLSFITFSSCYVFTGYWALTGLQPELLRIVSTWAFYGSIVSAAPLVDYIARMKTNKTSESFGEYSYPFYLVHIPVGFFVYSALGATMKTWESLTLGIVASLLISRLLIQFDRVLLHVRKRNKRSAIMTQPIPHLCIIPTTSWKSRFCRGLSRSSLFFRKK